MKQYGWIVMTKDGKLDHGCYAAESEEQVKQFLESDPRVDSALVLEEVKGGD